MKLVAQAAKADVGTWIDRTTRNDGVEILCDRKLIHFKRHSTVQTITEQWKQSSTDKWRSAICSSPTWREAVESGWIVSETITTAAGQRVWIACERGGGAFHRAMP